jgi:hypothetical protein
MGNKMSWSKQRGTSKRRRGGVEIDRTGGTKQPAFFVHVRKAGKNERGLMTTWKEGRRLGMCSSRRDTAQYYRSSSERREEKKGLLRRMGRSSSRKQTSKRGLHSVPVAPV